jgi:hypothetical protein
VDDPETGSKAPEKGPAATSIPESVQRWIDASTGVQKAATWLITALAAVGAFLFAKGFVTSPDLDWSSDKERTQLLWAWALGAAALGGVGYLIMAFVRLLLPVVYTLSSLPDGFKKEVDEHADWYLPTKSDNLAEFKDRLLFHRRVATNARREVDARAADVKRLAERVSREKTAAEKRALQEELSQAEGVLVLANYLLADAEANLKTYEDCRDALLKQAEYWTRGGAFEIGSQHVVSAAVIVALCGIGYQMVLSNPAEAEKDDDAAAASTDPAKPSLPAVGELTKATGPAGDDLWAALHLADCGVNGRASIDVLVLKGAGTPDDPYQVSTMPLVQPAATPGVDEQSACTTRIFNVIDDAARVTFEPVTTITYAPSPSATPTDDAK